MYIKMAGIDHNKASIEYREHFSFTKTGSIEAMKWLRKEFQLQGCIIVATCNRTELWISYDGKKEALKEELSAYEMLCRLKGLDPVEFAGLFVERNGEEAVYHLMKLTCGLESKIFGEDQIISQIREAMVIARRSQCTDIVLEKVFQTAIGAAKKVKSEVQLAVADNSAAMQAVTLLKKRLGTLQGVPCMVIGNGQMGKLTAHELLQQGAVVKMTLRKKIHGETTMESIIPEDCIMIPYENRIHELASVEVVVSATRSPHYTLKKDEVKGFLNSKPTIFVDLAVPRDIDPDITSFPQAMVFDMDHLGMDKVQESNAQSIKESMEILQEYLDELKQWFAFREMIPDIQHIIQISVKDVAGRIKHPVKEVPLKKEDKEFLLENLEHAVGKSIGKMLYGLKDTLREPLWEECLDAIHKSAIKDTIKF